MTWSPSITALSFGCLFRASTAGSAEMAVTSASTTVVSCADTRSDSTIRWAMTWRGRDIRWVVPRLEDGTTAGRAAGGAPGWAARSRSRSRGLLRSPGRGLRAGRLDDVLLADPAADTGPADAL